MLLLKPSCSFRTPRFYTHIKEGTPQSLRQFHIERHQVPARHEPSAAKLPASTFRLKTTASHQFNLPAHLPLTIDVTDEISRSDSSCVCYDYILKFHSCPFKRVGTSTPRAKQNFGTKSKTTVLSAPNNDDGHT